MADSIMGLDNGSRIGGDDINTMSEDYSDLAASSASSAVSDSHRNDQMGFEDDYTPTRHLLFEEVTQLSGIGCSLTTTLRTGYRGWNTASGIMFTVQPSKNIELLTVELPTFEDYSSDPSSAKNIQVYYRQGGFSGVMNNPSAWTSIADTTAHLVAPLPPSDSSGQTEQDMGVIVPANEFKKTSLKKDELYSIYIVGGPSTQNPKQTLLKLKPSDGLVGDKSAGNEELDIQTGVRLKGASFPMIFTDPADFNGVLHYKSSTSCEDSSVFANTEVYLLFAVNSDPNSNALGSLRSAVEETITRWMKTNESLVRFANEDMLKLDGIGTHFRGRNDKCPDNYENCSLISITLMFKHYHNLDKGKLQMEILRQHEDLDATVSSFVLSNTNPLESTYVGNPLSKVEFAITLTGVPNGQLMTNTQQRYFGDVTVNFLRKHMESKVFDVVVSDAVPEYLVIEDGEKPKRSRNLGSVPMLRGTRALSSESKIKVIAEVAAEGTVPEVRNSVLEGLGNFADEFTMELISHQMRPIEINQGDFFDSVTNSQVKPYEPPKVVDDVDTTSGTPTAPETGNETLRPVKNQGSVYVIVCILLIVLSFFWICYRIYMDCFYSPIEASTKLSKMKKKEEKRKAKRKKGKKNDVDEFKDEDVSPGNSGRKSSMFGGMKAASGFFGSSDSPSTRSTSSKSETKEIRASSHKTRSSAEDASKSSSKKDLDDADSFANDSCSLGDVESSDDESLEKLAPLRTSSGPKRGKLKPSKSLPVQKRDQLKADEKKPRKSANKPPKAPQRPPRRSPSGEPKRGRLTASKSMPVQKRSKSSDGISNTRKSSVNIPKGSQRSTPRRTPSGATPKRGKLKATKSMPVQKRDQSIPDIPKKKKSATKSSKNETPSASKRGKLTASKSMPVDKRSVKRNKSMPLTERKEELKSRLAVKKRLKEDASKDSEPVMPANLKKRLETQSSHSESKKLDRLSTHSESQKLDRKSWHPESKKIESRSSHSYTKKLEPRSSHSATKKKKGVEKKRGIKATKSMPLERRKKPESDKFIRLSDLYHDSTSDSDISDSSDEEASTSRNSSTSSWKSESSKKSTEGRKSHGKAGKIHFRAANGGLADVAE